MEIHQIPISDINPAEYNPRKISEDILSKLVAGIEEFDLVQPLIVNKDMTLIGGHQRLKAIEMLGWEEAPCIILDVPKDKEKILNIALNKIRGEFDEGKLKLLLMELSESKQDLSLAGLGKIELEKFLIAPEPKVEEWELGDLYEPFWLVIRGPLSEAHKVIRAVKELDIPNIAIEGSL